MTRTYTTFVVSQSFESLGDPCPSIHTTREAAEVAAAALRDSIAGMVVGWDTPCEQDAAPVGFIHETAAFRCAETIAGVMYDDNGTRTPDSPTTWGRDAGQYLAALAVEITPTTEVAA